MRIDLGPVLMNILERMCLRENEIREFYRALYSRLSSSCAVSVEEQYSGCFKNIRFKPITDKQFRCIGYEMNFHLGGSSMWEICEQYEPVKHLVQAHIPESHRTQLRGKKISDVFEISPVMSEFWSGNEIIEDAGDFDGSAYLSFRIVGGKTTYL